VSFPNLKPRRTKDENGKRI